MMVKNLDGIRSNLLNWLMKRPKRVVGIDIGSGCIKAAEVLFGRSGQAELTAVGALACAQNLEEAGLITKAAVSAEDIRQLLDNSGMVSRDVVVAVSSRAAFVREIILPVMKPAELKEAVKWDMEKYVPYEPGSYYYDFAVTGAGNNELENKVLLVAAPHSVINMLVAIVKQAECRLLAVDIEPLALCRTMSGAGNAMVIDIGSRLSQLVIFQEGSPVVNRTVAIGGYNFSQVIMQTYGLEYAESERWKQYQTSWCRFQDAAEAHPELCREFELLLDELVREVRRTVEYYQLQNRQAVIEQIYLTGGGAGLAGLPQLLAAKLGEVQVLLHNPLAAITLSPILDRQYLQKMAQQFALSIGLAMRGGQS